MNIDGLLLIIFSLFVGFCAFYCTKKDKASLSIALLLLLGFILRAYTASDPYLHCWDERYHALVAKNLIAHPLRPCLYREALLPFDYSNWAANHIWLHKQPLSLWLIAASMKLFGLHEYALRLPSLLFSTISIWLVYQIAQYFFPKKTAFLAAFFFTVNGLIIEIAGARVATDHPDTLFLAFILFAVLCSIRFSSTQKSLYNVAAGISLGAALLTKWLPALIVLPIWLLVLLDTHRFAKKQLILQFSVLFAVAMLIFLPWQWYIHTHFPQEALWERNYNTRHFFEALEGHEAPWYYYLNRIRIDYGELIYLPIIWACYQWAAKKKDFKWAALVLWMSIPLVFFSVAATKMNGYLLIAAPAFLILTAAFCDFLKNLIVPPSILWLKRIVLILIIALPIRYCIERVKPFEAKNTDHNWVIDLKNWNKKINPNTVLFGYNSPIEAMFYTDAIVYEQIPNIQTIISIQRLGYSVYINDSESLSDQVKALKGVSFIHLKQAN